MISWPVSWSRLPVGSSARSRRGWATRARAMAARCISPPESSPRPVLQTMPQPDHFQQLRPLGPVLAPAAQIGPDAVGNHQRGQHVFQRGQFGQEVIELEDHAELAVAQRVAAGGGQVVDPPAVEVDFALVRGVERAQQVQQRALARAALPDDRQKLALADAHAQRRAARAPHRPLAVALVQVGGGQCGWSSASCGGQRVTGQRERLRRQARCRRDG